MRERRRKEQAEAGASLIKLLREQPQEVEEVVDLVTPPNETETDQIKVEPGIPSIKSEEDTETDSESTTTDEGNTESYGDYSEVEEKMETNETNLPTTINEQQMMKELGEIDTSNIQSEEEGATGSQENESNEEAQIAAIRSRIEQALAELDAIQAKRGKK